MNDELAVQVIRSKRRKKTVQAKVDGNRLVVYMPAGLNEKEESELIRKMKTKIENKRTRKALNNDNYLERRADEFNKKYFNGKLVIHSINYVTNQNTRRGSCTPARGSVRISHELAQMPKWVLDYVIMHEITHLEHPDHSRKFWNKVNEYKYTERARGFLICKEIEKSDISDDDEQ
ncbi:MAG: M48 family metallopeptidase [ANME-2 cluster archaeon]|nr:M48 family metallopeptidase [ANME-2 cluster archaeon]MCL7474791.1 M48 family metallopeptidase [ANME-2 cluster archaeon]MDF1530852.1 M48 family metallopeptidase [ANME-2 cluster archaeon]MDW7776509.1 M48 family metallopeptidase [Methanosarcinales archaeon]